LSASVTVAVVTCSWCFAHSAEISGSAIINASDGNAPSIAMPLLLSCNPIVQCLSMSLWIWSCSLRVDSISAEGDPTAEVSDISATQLSRGGREGRLFCQQTG
jgi:hypothetical protein